MFDFYFYYAASVALSLGQNPYDTQTLFSIFGQLNAPHTLNQMTLGFAYPPHTLWLFAALSLMKFKHAMITWLIISLLLILASIKLLQVSFSNVLKHNEKYFFILILTILFFPLLRELSLGQVLIIPLIGISIFYCLIESEKKDFTVGLALSLTLIKPHIILIWLLSIILFAINNKRYRIITGLIVGFLAQCSVSYFIYPNGWIEYFYHQSSFSSNTRLLAHATLTRFLEVFSGSQNYLNYAPTLVGLLFVLLDSYKNRWNFRKSILIHLPLSIVLAPFGWLHDQTILLPTFLLILILNFKAESSLYRIYSAILVLFICATCYHPRFEFFMWLHAFVILCLGLYSYQSKKTAKLLM